ncbi:transcription/translation regulatory transformer protein RfaH [Aliivibrio sp. S3MY1]|uniref:transcription/translation regulatory transformer protein RfaH n=1 Tax=unclassified Aliivibrio TaxID=2645654 RepID=UPI002378BF84|nr:MULTISPECIES: transcription/translation regulatory transformer protein RfaH [unclassified Aliivibrio]MDD9195639.1 transcription/translation regulatory transformer protein RfaH [Aliivibrio sp. S3MY1]MDD9199062.1 transcription/translation regulatory transformer protein RfaH [Aliivibrio sp. S2MY1]
MKEWYLLYCKRGEQQRAKQHLENQQVECFYPEIEVEKITRGKITTKKEPLFPCYMFVRFDFNEGPSFTTVRSTRGVSDFIRFGGKPKVLQGDLIYSLKQLDKHEGSEIAEFSPEAGQKIGIKEGPFVGVEAIYKESDGEKRSILLITLINKKVEIKVDNSNLEY